MNFAKSIFLFSLFSCTSVELINSGLTHANELSTNVRDKKDFHLVSISPINETLNPEVSPKKSNSSLAQAAGGINSQNQIQDKKNDIGLAVQFGDSTSFGVQGKVGLTDNISIRPEVFFGSGSSVENKQTTFGIPSNDGLSTFINNASNSFTLPSAVTLNAPITSPSTFTTNAAVSSNGTTIPAGTVIQKGTIVPAGTVLPAGLTIPALTFLPGGTSYAPGFLKSKPTGTAFGLAVTYDIKLDPQGKSTAYIGPKVAFSSASGALTFGGVENPDVKLNTNETKIGLVAGADYAVSDNFTVGANVTYNISRSLNGSVSVGGRSLTDFIQSSGSAVDFGIRFGYQF